MQNTLLVKAERYRQQTEKNAELLLKKLISSKKLLDNLKVLVIGAGSFPSYAPLLKILNTKPHFTLVEPSKTQTELFLNHFAECKKTITIYNGDINQFLQTTQKKFDIIYLEHPETMTLCVVLAKLGVRSLKHIISLRESFPYLSRVLFPTSIIVASCMSTHELKQLKNLLNFSLEVKSKLIFLKQPLHFLYGGPYSSGLIVDCLPKSILPQKKSHAIKQSHFYLYLVLILMFANYIYFCIHSSGPQFAGIRLLMVILIGAQLYLHRPGKMGFSMKCLLLLAQCLLM